MAEILRNPLTSLRQFRTEKKREKLFRSAAKGASIADLRGGEQREFSPEDMQQNAQEALQEVHAIMSLPDQGSEKDWQQFQDKYAEMTYFYRGLYERLEPFSETKEATAEQIFAANIGYYTKTYTLFRDAITERKPWESGNTQTAEQISKRKRKKTIRNYITALQRCDNLPPFENAEYEDAFLKYLESYPDIHDSVNQIYVTLHTQLSAVKAQTVDAPTKLNEYKRQEIMNEAASSFIGMSNNQKLELLEVAGYTKEKAAKALKKIGIAMSITGVTTVAGDGGGLLAAGFGALHPYLEGMPNLKSIGVDALSYAGYYGTSFLKAIQNLRLIKRTGYGVNAVGTVAYYLSDPFVASQTRDKISVAASLGLDLFWDLFYGSAMFVPHVGTSMTADANSFGVVFTGAQVAGLEGVIRVVDENASVKHMKDAILQPNPIDPTQM